MTRRSRLSFATFLIAAVVAHAGSALAAPPFLGPELQVNTYTSGSQTRASVASDSLGNFVVVWNDVPYMDGRRLDAVGLPLGSQFRVSPATISSYGYPSVSMRPDGAFVVVWRSEPTPDNFDIVGRRFASDGSPIGPTFEVAASTLGEHRPRVRYRPDGTFVVVWSPLAPATSRLDVLARLFDSTGVPLGAAFQVNTYTTDNQGFQAVSADASGDFVVVWSSYGPASTDPSAIVGQRFDSSATPIGTEFVVAADGREPAVAHDPGGGFAVAWKVDDDGIFARRFDSAGAALGTEITVSASSGRPRSADLQFRGDGSFVVVWQGRDPPGSGDYDVFARRFDSTGAAVEGPLIVNATRRGTVRDPRLVLASAEGFSIIWSADLGLDGSGWGVFSTTVCEDEGSDGDADGIGDDCDPCTSTESTSIEPRLRLKLLGQAYCNEKLGLRFEATLPGGAPFATLDPLTVPLRIRLQTSGGLAPLDVTLPTGAPVGSETPGWTLKGGGTRWSFRDKSEAPANGVVGADISDRSSQAPGRVRMKIKGKAGCYFVQPGDEPLEASITFGDPLAGVCFETDYDADDCAFSSSDKKLRCQ